jgi:hypothetical protein
MASSGMLRCVALVKTYVSEERTRATWCNIPEDAILHSHRCENLKSDIALTGSALWRRHNVSCGVRTGFLYPRR